jgi:acyl carrier protein
MEGNTAQTQIEISDMIAGIWEEVLDVDDVKYDDSFFELGGNSLMAMVMMEKLNHKLEKKISISDIYQNDSLRKLAHYVERAV